MADFYKRISVLGYALEVSTEAKDFIAEKGYDAQFGARPLKRAIQTYLEDEIAELILSGALQQGDIIEAVMDKEAGKLKVEPKRKEVTV